MKRVQDYLGKNVTVKGADGSVVYTGKVVAGTEAPTLCIATPDGQQVYWRADLCEVTPQRMAAEESGPTPGDNGGTGQ